MFSRWSEGSPVSWESAREEGLADSWLRLLPPQGGWPSGMVLLRGRLACAGARGQTFLRLVWAGEGEQVLALPVSRRGTLLEMVDFGDSPVEVLLQPASGGGRCRPESLSIRRQRGIEPLIRELQRVVPMFWRWPRIVRHRLGLRSHLLLTDRRMAYRRAGELRDYVPDNDYPRWIRFHDLLCAEDRRLIASDIQRWKEAPRFLIFIDDASRGDVSASLDSLDDQIYRNFCLLNGDDSLEEDGGAGWLVYLPAGVRLSEHALYWLASEIQRRPEVRAIYADHDLRNAENQPVAHCFKPDCSPALLASSFYMGPLLAIHLVNGNEVSRFALYARLFKLALRPGSVFHIPGVLSHVPVEAEWRCPETELALLKVFYPSADIVPGLLAHHWRIRHRLPDDLPRISVIVPTRDNLAVLRSCIDSLLTRSRYPELELLVVDNQSIERETLDYLDGLSCHAGVRVLRYDHPFNYSAINNWAVEQATGSIVCLLNNDTEVISAEWLHEMLGELLQPGVGAVGAKLYYGDGSVQHAGDAVGPGGCADHFFSGLSRSDSGYMDRAFLVQDLSAVTAACLLTYKNIYQSLGGLDEINLPVAFNDVDYCLRVRGAGHRIVWTPFAELYHHESISRGRDDSPEKKVRRDRELAYMKRRWNKALRSDPYYNPNLSYERPDFSLARQPRVVLPWRRNRGMSFILRGGDC